MEVDIWWDAATLQAWLEAEAAFAQAKLGLIPSEAAEDSGML